LHKHTCLLESLDTEMGHDAASTGPWNGTYVLACHGVMLLGNQGKRLIGPRLLYLYNVAPTWVLSTVLSLQFLLQQVRRACELLHKVLAR
jgi:hypothetical protein